MYTLPRDYANYYKDFINRDVREFKLECNIASESDISSINIDYDLMSGAEEYTIGNLAPAKLTMTVSSNIQIFETNEITLTIKLKVEDIHGKIIWVPVPIGKFYVFDIKSTKLSKTITAYDNLYKSELERTYNSTLEYPITVHEILDEICPLLNITYDIAIPNITIERPEVVTESRMNNKGKYEVVVSASDQVCIDMTVGHALTCIAGYLGGNFIVDGDSKLKLITFPTEKAKSCDFRRYSEPIFGEATYSMNHISCTTYPNNVITVGYNDTSSSMVLDNQLMNRTRLLMILEQMSNISYTQASARLKGDPTLQLGDLIEIYEINELGNAVNRHTIPILRMSFSYTGGCTNSIESPCKAATERNINYKGTISSRLDNLESNVVVLQGEMSELYTSVSALEVVKNNMDDMDLLVDRLGGYTNSDAINQYNSILNKIKESDAVFEEEYDLVYNNKYL